MLRSIKPVLALSALFATVGAAHAEVSPGDFSFAVGQIVGSSMACGMTKADVTPVAEKAFAKLKVDIQEGNDNYKRFVSGITDGAKQVKDGAAKCDDVKQGFVAFSEKVK